MIQATVYRNAAEGNYSFVVCNHGESYVCAAVSMLVINTINSIEVLTGADFASDSNEEEGRIQFSLRTSRAQPEGQQAGILLDAMVLGLESVAQQHPDELTITINIEERE